MGLIMKLKITRTDLLRALGHVHGVVERKNTIPILANVSLKTREDSLVLTTCDMEVEICETVPAEVEMGGATTVPVHTLYDIARKLHDDADITLQLDDDNNRMNVHSGRAKFKLGCLPVSDFPSLSNDDFQIGFQLDSDDLRSMIDTTRFSMSTEETRYYLNGIYVHPVIGEGEGVLRAAATDGLRLARYETSLPENAGEMKGIIIPRKTVNEIRKLLDDAADSVDIKVARNKIRFEFDQLVLISKLIDGTFPEYEKVIPANNDKVIEIDSAVFAKAIDRVAVISDVKSRAVKISVADNLITVSANSPEAGSAVEEFEIDSGIGESIDIGFNSKYLLDIMSQMGDEICRVSMSDSASAVKIESTADGSALYVVMPMRV